jgi:hypothetical protein
MSRRRDWDRVGRQRRIYLNGSIPDWVEGWAPGLDWLPVAVGPTGPAVLKAKRIQNTTGQSAPRPKLEQQTEEDEFGEWTLLCLDYSEVGGKMLQLRMIGGSGNGAQAPPRRETRVTHVKYSRIDIPQTEREAIVRRYVRGLNSNFGRQLRLFYKELCKVGKLSCLSLRGSILTFEFEFRNRF